jgi:small-conductance mechanosensitive channel
VSDRLNVLDRRLRHIAAQLSESVNLSESADELRGERQDLSERAGLVEAALRQAPAAQDLLEMETDWHRQVRKLDHRSLTIRELLTELEGSIRELESENKVWELTRTQLRQEVGTEIVVKRINSALSQIGKTLKLALEQRRANLMVQDLLAQQSRLASDVSEEIRSTEQKQNKFLLQPDRPPLWQISSISSSGALAGQQEAHTLSKKLSQTAASFKNGWQQLLLMVLILAALSKMAVIVARKLAKRFEGRPGPGDASVFFAYPDRTALVASVWFLSWLPLLAPIFLGQLVSSLMFLLFLLLVPPLIPVVFRPLLYLLTGIYTLSRLWSFFASVPLLERFTSFFALAATLALGVQMMRKAQRSGTSGRTLWQRLGVRLIWIALALIAGALTANLFGYSAIAKLLSRGVTLSALSAVRLYVLARIVGALFSLLLRSRWAQSFASARLRGNILYKWAARGFVSVLVIACVLTTLSGFRVDDEVLKWLQSIFGHKIVVGQISFTLWDVIVFGLVLLASYAISKIVEFFLQDDVLPRLSLQRGLSNTILAIVHYSFLAAGFLMAMVAAGLSLDRFTVLAGAFGVGIGFGLQNIFNNFASGLILLFERPIRLNDTVEVAGVVGNVRHIGIRASTIHTIQGADVIVPNSELVSNRVTNWTYLDNPMRRVELKVMVGRGTEPERVLKLLTDVAGASAKVEKEPPPVAVFCGFGESTLNFELRYWVQFQNLGEVESSVGLAVVSALRQANIEVPLPQRELYLKSAADITPGLARNGGQEQADRRGAQAGRGLP